MRKRKVTYPPAKTATKKARPVVGVPGDPTYVRSTVASIDLSALNGRNDIVVGQKVRIGGDGLYAGETAVVESVLGGLIPAATVRTEAGKVRRVRAVDLQRLPAPGAAGTSGAPSAADASADPEAAAD